jgi:serine/threonine protein kinase
MEWISDLVELQVNDIYMTYKGLYKGIPCVIKFFVDQNFDNNEFEILKYFQRHSNHPEWYPIPFFINTQINSMVLPVFGTPELVEDIFKIICYEYIQAFDMNGLFNSNKSCIDLVEHLNDMHKMKFIHSDIKPDNILLDTNLRYRLIDYGNAFSMENTMFPPLQYMIDSGEIPNMNDDIGDLNKTIRKLENQYGM